MSSTELCLYDECKPGPVLPTAGSDLSVTPLPRPCLTHDINDDSERVCADRFLVTGGSWGEAAEPLQVNKKHTSVEKEHIVMYERTVYFSRVY